jgi:hypothetical protein
MVIAVIAKLAYKLRAFGYLSSRRGRLMHGLDSSNIMCVKHMPVAYFVSRVDIYSLTKKEHNIFYFYLSHICCGVHFFTLGIFPRYRSHNPSSE